MTAIHWFRRDLRLADNPALLAAAADGRTVVPLFVLDDELLSASGAPRRAYLLRSLRALHDATGGRLVVRRGRPERVLPELAHEVGAAEVHVASSYEPAGRRRDGRVRAALEEADARLVETGSPYAVAPGRLLTGGGTPFQVFTPFRTAWLAHGWRAPATGPEPRWADGVRGDDLPDEPGLDGLDLPAAGEAAARERWAAMLDDGLAGYADDRNRPDLDATSRLSPALKWGEIHPRTLLADLARQRGDGAAAFRSELAWREFHADVLFHHPTAARQSLREVAPEDSWVTGERETAALEVWAAGRTGYPFVDAGMRQLRAQGWMHGRLRMVTASFLVKDLHVAWQRGAAHFMRWLVDGDVPQNQLNWQWVAGTGRDAAPYFRVFNPVTQGRTLDPDGTYVRRWVPELRQIPGAAVHEPWKLPRAAAPEYPERVVDHAQERKAALDAHARRAR